MGSSRCVASAESLDVLCVSFIFVICSQGIETFNVGSTPFSSKMQCFSLMNPQLQKKKSECHSYYYRQRQAAPCINQGDCGVFESEEVMGWELVAKTGWATRF